MEYENCSKLVNDIIKDFRDNGRIATGDISDTHHTFDELYTHRTKLFAWGCNMNKDNAWKSKLHFEGDMFDGMFIAGVTTPEGNYTYHCEMEFWNLFKVKELERGLEWDGHTAADIDRLFSLEKSTTANHFKCHNPIIRADCIGSALNKFIKEAMGLQQAEHIAANEDTKSMLLVKDVLEDFYSINYSKNIYRLDNGVVIKIEVWRNDDGVSFYGKALEIID